MPETTSKLFHRLRGRESGKAFLSQERTDPTCAQVLQELWEQAGVSAPEWIAAADISKSYAYQVLRGERIPGRDILLRTALAFFPAAIVGSVLWQSMALALVYGGDAKQAFFLAKLVSRSIQFALTGTVDTLIVWLLQRSGALRAVGLPPVQSKGNDIQ